MNINEDTRAGQQNTEAIIDMGDEEEGDYSTAMISNLIPSLGTRVDSASMSVRRMLPITSELTNISNGLDSGGRQRNASATQLFASQPTAYSDHNIDSPTANNSNNNRDSQSSIHSIVDRMRFHFASENESRATENGSSIDNNPPASTSTGTLRRQRSESWRMNLNEVLSFSTSPARRSLRSLISNSRGSFRYTPPVRSQLLGGAAPAAATSSTLHLEDRHDEDTTQHRDNVRLLLGGNNANHNNLREMNFPNDWSGSRLIDAARRLTTISRNVTVNATANISNGNNLGDTYQRDLRRNTESDDNFAMGSSSSSNVNNRPVNGNNGNPNSNILNSLQQQQQHQQQSHRISMPRTPAVVADEIDEHLNMMNINQNANNNNNNTHDDDNNVIADIFVRGIGHFLHYLPYIGIVFVKFIHDNLLNIWSIIPLHGTVYYMNKSLCAQVTKFSQKNNWILLRDLFICFTVLVYRFSIAPSTPEIGGLLIPPPNHHITITVTSSRASSLADQHMHAVRAKDEKLNLNERGQTPSVTTVGGDTTTEGHNRRAGDFINSMLYNGRSNHNSMSRNPTTITDQLDNTVVITEALTMGMLMYYVAINDLVMKLITIFIKIMITMLPVTLLRYKQRARSYVFIENVSQILRAMAPVRQWLSFLYHSYSGLETISAILFASFYLGAKGFESIERGKSLMSATMRLVKNMDYKHALNKLPQNAEQICPICHDVFNSPMVLDCTHIFCDDCISQWLTREQTCPMCRAKINEDPLWQDGATTYFYQLC